MAKDFYDILGLQRGVSDDELKRTYRRLSKEWHPDKHKGDKAAEQKFKEINQAYEVLSDPQKRKTYDQYGEAGMNGGGAGRAGGFGGFDFSNFSGDIGGFSDLFETFFGGARGRQPAEEQQGGHHEATVQISFADVVTGVQRMIKLRRLQTCETCKGTGGESGSSLISCSECGGTGQVVKESRSFFGRIQQSFLCTRCAGSGKVPEHPCRTCRGEGYVGASAEVAVQIPAGIDDGQTLRVRGQGDAGRRGAAAGDLFVHVRVTPDLRFIREGSDIRSTVPISVVDAILGVTIAIDTVRGEEKIAIAAGTQSGQILRLKGKGLPILNTHRSGDHYVTVNVEIPKKLSREERRLMEEWKKIQ